jgi:hypothetical protein
MPTAGALAILAEERGVRLRAETPEQTCVVGALAALLRSPGKRPARPQWCERWPQ